MDLSWNALVERFNRFAPEGTALRKIILVLSIILTFEGISVLLLFSYDAAIVGVLSIAIGFFLLALAYPEAEREVSGERVTQAAIDDRALPIGLRLLERIVDGIGGGYVLMFLGALVIIFVLLFNTLYSARSNLGDLDTLTIMFGGMMIVYPLIAGRFRVEAAFSLVFLGIVEAFLVIPQAAMSIHSGAATTAGNWYVHYMLAAPFAGILDLVGIHASSSANSVTMILQDGSPLTLGISAYCAGLYSFSIFVSAFMTFVLVLERMRAKYMTLILGLGLLVAYIGNLFRMVVIGLVGYYNGLDALLWAHRNVGWMIFLAWSSVFWYLILGYAARHPEKVRPASEDN